MQISKTNLEIIIQKTMNEKKFKTRFQQRRSERNAQILREYKSEIVKDQDVSRTALIESLSIKFNVSWGTIYKLLKSKSAMM